MKNSTEKFNILLCASSSVAAIKIPELVAKLNNTNLYNVKIIYSSVHAFDFLTTKSKEYNKHYYDIFETLGGPDGDDFIVTDEEEWYLWNKIGDIVLHIELRKWADIILIAPASANLIAKISTGQSDSLLLSVLRAIKINNSIHSPHLHNPSVSTMISHSNISSEKQQYNSMISQSTSTSTSLKHNQQSNAPLISLSNTTPPCILCPAMNTHMWDHPITHEQLHILNSWGYHIIEPVVKILACHDIGKGAMASVDDIINIIQQYSYTSTDPSSSSSRRERSHSNNSNSITDNNPPNFKSSGSVFLNNYFNIKNRKQTCRKSSSSDQTRQFHFPKLFYMFLGGICAVFVLQSLQYIDVELNYILKMLIKFIYQLNSSVE